MENNITLNEINDPNNINQAISQDEEQQMHSNFAAMLMAEELILQLPPDHQQRNEWLVKFGQSAEASEIRNAGKDSV